MPSKLKAKKTILKGKSYSDGTYASLEDESFQDGIVAFIQGENKKVAPFSWQSKKLDRVTKSPLSSKTLTLNETGDAGFLVCPLVQEIFGIAVLPPVQCYTDNESLTSALETKSIISNKRLNVYRAKLREMVLEGVFKVFLIDGKLQLVDSLIKRGTSTQKLFVVLSTEGKALEALGNVKYPFIAITPSSTLIWSGSTF